MRDHAEGHVYVGRPCAQKIMCTTGGMVSAFVSYVYASTADKLIYRPAATWSDCSATFMEHVHGRMETAQHKTECAIIFNITYTDLDTYERRHALTVGCCAFLPWYHSFVVYDYGYHQLLCTIMDTVSCCVPQCSFMCCVLYCLIH